jgi:hypothetical protein
MEARLRLNKSPEVNLEPKFDINVLLGGLFTQRESDRMISLTIY